MNKGISIDSIHMNYALDRLSSVRLNKVTLSGLRIEAVLDQNNRIKIKGLELPEPSGSRAGKDDRTLLPFLPDKIILQNSTLVLETPEKTFFIPFNVLADVRSEQAKIITRTVCYPFGEKIHGQVIYDLNKGIEFVKIDGKSFDLNHLNHLISNQTSPFKLNGPVDFTLETRAPESKWQINVSQVGIGGPVNAGLTDFSSAILIEDSRIRATGGVSISTALLPLTAFEYSLSMYPGKKGLPFELAVNTRETKSYQVHHNQVQASIKNLQLNAGFQGNLNKSKGNIIIKMTAGQIDHHTEKLNVDDTEIRTNLVADFSKGGKGISGSLQLVADKIRFKASQMTSQFPSMSVAGKFGLHFRQTSAQDKNKLAPFARMTFKGAKGNITSAPFKIKASGIRFEIPIEYPFTGKKSSGTYSIPKISYNRQYHFSTSGRIVQTGARKIRMMGHVNLKALPGLKTSFISHVGFENKLAASLDFKTNRAVLNTADIEKLIPRNARGAECKLTLFAEGHVGYSNHQLKTDMQFNVTDANLKIPDMNLSATGINTTLNLNNLIVPESIPGQILTVDAIEMNKIQIHDARVRFSIEDARSILVENIRFKWCNGLVSSEAIRFPSASDVYALTLYCDRLELTQLLEQMGAFHAKGSGTLSGRIPVLYKNGDISFDNGFLFSTPGNGGKIVVLNPDRITAGIPMDSPQFSQLDLAQEALKDFDYNWAKLVFNTFEDTLYVKMELDGKPSKPLPFEYRKETGGFIRVGASSPGSNFQGIKLDVNLNLPFNEVMKFGNKLKSIFDR